MLEASFSYFLRFFRAFLEDRTEVRSMIMTEIAWKGEPPFWHPARQEAFILDWDGVLAETSLDFRPLFAKHFGGKRVMLLETLPSLEPSRRRAIEEELVHL